MPMITVNLINPITGDVIENVSANSRSNLMVQDDGNIIMETHIIANVELDSNHQPVENSLITGRKIDM